MLLLALFQFSSPLLAQEASAVSQSLADFPPPEKDKAQIIFFKPMLSKTGKLHVHLFEIEEAGPKLIGVLWWKSRAIVNVAPGKHMFMSTTAYGFSHFLNADLEPGKRYFVLARYMYVGGFQLRPIKLNGPADFTPENSGYKSLVAGTTESKLTPEIEASYRGNKRSQKTVAKYQAESWEKWLAKTPEQRAELTLNKEDFLD
ncbi:MAG: hypothetical protein ACREO1_03135 [Arenimonas sp.]